MNNRIEDLRKKIADALKNGQYSKVIKYQKQLQCEMSKKEFYKYRQRDLKKKLEREKEQQL